MMNIYKKHYLWLESMKNKHDFVLIAPIDTLTGHDLFKLSAQSHFNILNLGIKGGWNASLDAKDMILTVAQSSDSSLTYQIRDIQNTTVLIADMKSCASRKILENNNNHVIQLGECKHALEELSEFLSHPLSQEMKAHIIYSQDYISGLTAAGIPFTSTDITQNNVCFRTIIQNELAAEGNLEIWEEMKQIWRESNSVSEVHFSPISPTNPFLELFDLQEVKLFHVDTKIHPDFTKQFLNFLNSLEIRKQSFENENHAEKYTESSNNLEPIKLDNKLILYTKGEERSGEFGRLNYQNVELIEFFIHNDHNNDLDKIVKQFNQHPEVRCQVYGGRHSSYFSARFTDSQNVNTLPLVNSIVDELLGLVLHFYRPLRHYGCTFFMPFRLRENEELIIKPSLSNRQFDNLIDHGKNVKHKHPIDRFNYTSNEYDAFLYLNPVIRKQLYPTKYDLSTKSEVNTKVYEYSPWKTEDEKCWENYSDRIPLYIYDYSQLDKARLFARNKINQRDNWSLKIGNTELEGDIETVKLYSFDNSIYILELSVFNDFFLLTETELSLTKEGSDWWHDLFSLNIDKDNIKRSLCNNWLTYTQKMRELMPLFDERPRDNIGDSITYAYHCRDNRTTPARTSRSNKNLRQRNEKNQKAFYYAPDDIVAIVRKLGLEDFDKYKLEIFTDNRMFINASYCFSGNPIINKKSESNYEILFAAAAYVDSSYQTFDRMNNYAYDPEFTQVLLQQHRYNRWNALGNRYAFTDYSNVYFGFGNTFHREIGSCHVFYNYQRTLLLTLFYKEKLDYFSHEIARSSLALTTSKDRTKYQSLKQEFIQFSNTFWFDDVSSQVQGKEIFGKQSEALNLKKEYHFIEHEIQVADAYIQSDIASKFTRIGGYVAGFGIFMEIVKTFVLSLRVPELMTKNTENVEKGVNFFTSLTLFPLIMLLFVIALVHFGGESDIKSRQNGIKLSTNTFITISLTLLWVLISIYQVRYI